MGGPTCTPLLVPRRRICRARFSTVREAMVGSIISSSGEKRRFAHVGRRFGSGIRCQPSRPDQRQEWMHSNDHWQATVVPDTMWGNSQDQAPDQRQTWMHSNDHWQAARTTTCRQLKRPLAGITCEVCSVCVCVRCQGPACVALSYQT